MKHLLAILVAATAFGACSPATAAEQTSSDAAIKQKLLGYWRSPRHGYLIKSDGVMYMCPRDICTTTNKWDVKNGKFYQDSEPYDIVMLTDKKFVYRPAGKKEPTYTLERATKEEVD